MTPVEKYQLKNGKYYLGYGDITLYGNRKRKILFMFVMTQYSDSVYPIFAYSNYRDNTLSNIHELLYIKSETRLMALCEKMDFFELTDEEFLLHSVGETI